MSSPPVFFNFLAQVEHVFFQLSTSKLNGFPVVNSAGQPIGIIERDSLIQLIKKRAWYSPVPNIEANNEMAQDVAAEPQRPMTVHL